MNKDQYTKAIDRILSIKNDPFYICSQYRDPTARLLDLLLKEKYSK